MFRPLRTEGTGRKLRHDIGRVPVVTHFGRGPERVLRRHASPCETGLARHDPGQSLRRGQLHADRAADKAGNTYQLRRLDDGGTFEILKNFPVRDRLIESLTGKAKNFEYVELD